MPFAAEFRRRGFPRFAWMGGVLLILTLAGVAFGQREFRGGRGGRNLPESVKSPREIPTRSTDTPMWENSPAFTKDVFTFTRLRYGHPGGSNGAGGGSWMTDLPDADLNLSYRLQQMTSLKVDPYARIIRLSS
jgi:hypothetical protein